MSTKKIRFILIFLIALTIPVKPTFCAEVEKVQENIYGQRDNLVQAIGQWKKEAKLYHEQKKSSQEIEAILKIAHGYIKLGQFRLAIIELETVQEESVANSQTKALIDLRLGNAYRGNGQYQQAIIAYKSSLEAKTSLSTLNNLVRTLHDLQQSTLLIAREITNKDEAQRYYAQAQSYEQQAVNYSNQALLRGQNEMSSAYVYSLIEWSKLKQNKLGFQQLVKAQSILDQLAQSPSSVDLLINWAAVDSQRSIYWLGKAEKISQKSQDPQLESYVYLELAYEYQKKQNLVLALKYAKQAQAKAQPEIASESLYRSQKLMGDIYQQIGKRNLAIDSYRNSISSIDILSRAISRADTDLVTKFNRAIQPVYKVQSRSSFGRK